MNELLFATPWYLPAAVLIVGLFVFWTGNKRQQSRVQHVGVGFMLLAIAWATVSYQVETDTERVSRYTRELVHAVEARDWKHLGDLLDAKTSLSTTFLTLASNREALVKMAQTDADRYGLKSIGITSLQPTKTDSLITTDVTVISIQEITMERPVISEWQLDWQKTANDWQVNRITCIRIGTDKNENVSKYLKP